MASRGQRAEGDYTAALYIEKYLNLKEEIDKSAN